MAEDRFERLANLVTALLDSRHGMTYAEIMAGIPGYPEGDDARRRAFERDKRLLRDEDIPLQENEGRYRIPPEEYFLADLQLTEEEHLALQLAMAAVPVGGGQGGWALRKLRLAGPGADPAGAGPTLLADLDEHPLLPSLHGAIRRRCTVSFSHSGTTRTVDPSRLLFRDGHWYLQGFDRLRQDLRNFRVDRIEGEVEVGSAGTADPPAQASAARASMPREPWLIGGDEPGTAVVRVDAVLAAKAVDDVGPAATVERHHDGSVTITLAVVQRAALRSWLLGFLDHAVVVGPADLRAEMVDWLAAVASAGER